MANKYLLTYLSPTLAEGARGRHCFLFTTVQMNAIENLRFAPEI